MTNRELAKVIDLHIKNALSLGELTEDQADALDYYYGRPYGNEIDGQSQVVTREVLQVIEQAMPSLMRIFASEKAVEFDPVGPDDSQQAKQETDAIRHVAWKYSDGFMNVYNWCKDGILQRVGYAKVFIEEEEETVEKTFEGLKQEDLMRFPDDSIVGLDELVTDLGVFYNATVSQKVTHKKPKWSTIGPEAVRVSKRVDGVCLDDAEFVAHVEDYTESDLLEMGIPRKVVDSLPSSSGDEHDSDSVDTARSSHSGEDYSEENWAEKAARPIEVWECYVKTDDDDDGITELMRVLYAGHKILKKEKVDFVPIIGWSPVPMPHQHAGLSLADMVMDIQKIKSSLMRQSLDNLWLTNNPEKEVVWDDVLEPADLLQSVPGGLKRVKKTGTITPLTVPFTAGASMPMMEMLDEERHERVGISKVTAGLDADVLAQSTKGAFMAAMDQANGRLEMVARLFAETALKKLYLKLHALMIDEVDEELRLNLNGEFVDVSPSQWRRRQDLTVTIGTGNATVEQRGMLASQVLQLQERIVQAGGMGRLVDEANIYNAAVDFVDALGKENGARYFNDPAQLEPPQPKPDPNQQIIEAQMALEQMKEQNRREIDMARIEVDRINAQTNQMKVQLQMRDIQRKEVETEVDIAKDIAGMGATMPFPQVVPE